MLSSLLINLQESGWRAGRSESRPARGTTLGRSDVGRLQAFGPFRHLKFHSGAFIQAPVALRLNRREVHEDIFSVLP